jgi:hypothetical protein
MPGMAPLEAPQVPIAYQLLKSAGHSTMAISEVVSPYLDNPANQSWRGAMLANRSQIVELELPPYTNATTLLGAQRRT